MSTENQIQECPPRYLTEPQVPVPQTCSGVLADYGYPSDPYDITDIPPDFSWMSSIPIFYKSFNMAINQIGNLDNIYLPGNPTYPNATTWHRIPFSCARWWNGTVKLDFMAIKPQEVTGKILFTYFPDISSFQNGNLNKAPSVIGPKAEWDLGLTSEFSLEIPGFNPAFARPTWVPDVVVDSDPTIAGNSVTNNYTVFPLQQLSFGGLSIDATQSLQPGSIYPDSIRILIFISFQNCVFQTSCDPRSVYQNVLAYNNLMALPAT